MVKLNVAKGLSISVSPALKGVTASPHTKRPSTTIHIDYGALSILLPNVVLFYLYVGVLPCLITFRKSIGRCVHYRFFH